MILSDRTIRKMVSAGDLLITPFPQDVQFQPASVDLRLGNGFQSPYAEQSIRQDSYLIGPGDCVLATTMERVGIPDDIVARVEGKSSWGRKFLMVHSTAGFIDPGFHGTITLELCNLSAVSQVVRAGMSIAQISFQFIDKSVDRPYGSRGLRSHYQDQDGVTPSAEPWY